MTATTDSAAQASAEALAASAQFATRAGATVRVMLADGRQLDAVFVADDRRLRLAQVISTLAKWSAVLVGVMYAIGGLLAQFFYRRFGLSATSVGLSSSDVVGQAAGAAVWLVIMATVALVPILLVFPPRLNGKSVTDAAQQGFLRRVLDVTASGGAVLLTFLGPVAVSGLMYGFSAGNAGIPFAAGALAVTFRSVWPGGNKRSTSRAIIVMYVCYAVIGLGIAVLGVRSQASDALRGHVDQTAPWSLAPTVERVMVVSEGAADKTGVLSNRCVVKLGHNGGVWLLWDYREHYLWQTNMSLQARSCTAKP